MHHFMISLASIALMSCTNGQGGGVPAPDAAARIAASDFDVVVGDDWTGALTYLDYSPPFGDVTIPATIAVARTETGISFDLQYPDEPHANSSGEMAVEDEGRAFAGGTVISSTEAEDGTVTFTTEESCTDNDQAAVCAITYTLAPARFAWTKMVTLTATGASFRRNEYVFTREARR